MKILCSYFDPCDSFLDNDPVEVLVGHDVTVAHSYTEVHILLTHAPQIPAFDVVLIDAALPGDHENENQFKFPVLPLLVPAEDALVRGFGVFIPADFEELFDGEYNSYHVLVGDNTCWTANGGRDWKKLLGLVMRKLEEIEV